MLFLNIADINPADMVTVKCSELCSIELLSWKAQEEGCYIKITCAINGDCCKQNKHFYTARDISQVV